MKKISVLLAIIALVLASLACQTVMGGGNDNIQVPDMPAVTEVVPQGNNNDMAVPTGTPVSGGDGITVGGQTDFPLPDDASNLVNMGNDIVNFQTKLSLDDAVKFYRDQFGKLGYTERDLLTVTSSTTFSMVFDGHASGKAISIQGVDLGGGSINISIALVDL
jgi:predicted small secreted protein